MVSDYPCVMLSQEVFPNEPSLFNTVDSRGINPMGRLYLRQVDGDIRVVGNLNLGDHPVAIGNGTENPTILPTHTGRTFG